MLSIFRIIIKEFSGMFALSISIILVLILITGCQTAAIKKARWIYSNMREATQRVKICTEYIENKPVYQSLFNRLPRPKNITPMHMADTSKPTKEDVKNIIAVYNEDAQCRKQSIEDMSRIVPSTVPILVDGYRANDLVTAELIERKISWGEANKRRSDIYSDVQAKFRAEGSRVEEELKMSHSAEIANRQAALNAVGNSLQEWGKQQQAQADRMQNQQLIDNLNRPRSTNCQIIGNTVQCTTY